MSDTIFVTFYWHQHQPHYVDPVTGRLAMPWVRLHAVKDYVDMALVAERFNFKQTINLVPTLIEQLEGYANGSLSDDALELSRRAPADLDEKDRQYMLKRFFDANESTMIRSHPRYLELLLERRHDSTGCLKSWKEADWRDLQVWFNLSWMDPLWQETKGDISATLIEKGRDFSEDDKQALLQRHVELCGEVVKVHRRLQEAGLIEVTITPYAHPILPLLIDTNIARVCQPNDPLPRPAFQYPQDADRHLQFAVERYKKDFGSPPRGMWPSEGSVSPDTLDAIAANGLKWCATDEAIVGGSAVEIDGAKFPSGGDPYRPYSIETKNGPLQIIFRDHELSDHIGFHYFTTPPGEAAKHFVHRLIEKVRARVPSGPALAAVILDGENCWEHFPRDGHDFIEALIKEIQSRKALKPLTVSEMLQEFPKDKTGYIQKIKPGSWINGNYRIWIGDAEENRAWELLRQVRSTLEENAKKIPDKQKEEAWHSLMLAEGSDWFWWYGETNNSDHDEYFDALFRGHLRQALKAAGCPPLPDLDIPMPEQVQKVRGEHPSGRLAAPPNLQGTPLDFFAWKGAIPLDPGVGGAMHEVATRDWSGIVGWHGNTAYLRLKLDEKTCRDVTCGDLKLTWKINPGREQKVEVLRYSRIATASAALTKKAIQSGYAEISILLYNGDQVLDQLPGVAPAVLDLSPLPVWLV